LDPGTRKIWDKPSIQEAMHALDQIKVVHGHSPMETHGFAGFRFINEFPPGTDKWDKDWEYRLFLKDALLREETTFYPERILDEQGWMALEAYAIEDTGVNEDIVYKGNLFRKMYLGCSKREGCIKRKNGPIEINNDCRQKCQNEAVKETGFFTKDEIEHVRKARRTMV